MQVDQSRNWIALSLFRGSSLLFEPLSKSHECFRRIDLVDRLNPEGYQLVNLFRKALLASASLGCFSLSLVTGVPALGLRALAVFLQKGPWIYVRGNGEDKKLSKDRTFTLLSWNVCFVGGGYSITDGGVMPWSFRINQVIDKIIRKDADVTCLYEVFDSNAAVELCKRLEQKGYRHFYFNHGARIVGFPAGIFVASKFKIARPDFSEFPMDATTGRAKHVAKGFFGFDLESRGRSFARIFSTHMQHSEKPEFPTPDEIQTRRRQMELILSQVKKELKCAVVTGDINADNREASRWHSQFSKKDHEPSHEKTWGGDGFCANLGGRIRSGPLNLDQTKAFRVRYGAVQTKLTKTGFEGDRFHPSALSDHRGLLSRIVV